MARNVGEQPDLDRRRFFGRAAVVGTAVWAVPTIVTIEPAAAAEATSPPPEPDDDDTDEIDDDDNDNDNDDNDDPEVLGESTSGTTDDPEVLAQSTPGNTGGPEVAGSQTTAGGQARSRLADTGADLDDLVAGGLAAVAGGAALQLWKAELERDSRQ